MLPPLTPPQTKRTAFHIRFPSEVVLFVWFLTEPEFAWSSGFQSHGRASRAGGGWLRDLRVKGEGGEGGAWEEKRREEELLRARWRYRRYRPPRTPTRANPPLRPGVIDIVFISAVEASSAFCKACSSIQPSLKKSALFCCCIILIFFGVSIWDCYSLPHIRLVSKSRWSRFDVKTLKSRVKVKWKFIWKHMFGYES